MSPAFRIYPSLLLLPPVLVAVDSPPPLLSFHQRALRLLRPGQWKESKDLTYVSSGSEKEDLNALFRTSMPVLLHLCSFESPYIYRPFFIPSVPLLSLFLSFSLRIVHPVLLFSSHPAIFSIFPLLRCLFLFRSRITCAMGPFRHSGYRCYACVGPAGGFTK